MLVSCGRWLIRAYDEHKIVVALLLCNAGTELDEISVDIIGGSWLLEAAAVGCEARDVLPEKSIDDPSNDGLEVVVEGNVPGVSPGVGKIPGA